MDTRSVYYMVRTNLVTNTYSVVKVRFGSIFDSILSSDIIIKTDFFLLWYLFFYVQIRYLCAMAGCDHVDDSEVTTEEDILVLTRNTQTVRAVDAKMGTEK